MPDSTKQTISATQSPALFGASSYLTRWMLYMQFAGKAEMETTEPNPRMEWGKKMQPLVLDQVAKDQKLEVVPNNIDSYIRRGLLGCTRDATIICPSRGPGALEIKCVFDYTAWMQKWNGGKTVPREYEIQLQQQMFVGDESWGMIAVWVCADLYYFERKPIIDLWQRLNVEAADFFAQVKGELPAPKPFGAPIEIPWLTSMFPTVKNSVLDLSHDPVHVKTSEKVSMYQFHSEQESGAKTGKELIRGELLALAMENEMVLLPCGVNYRIQKSGRGKTIKPYVPEVPLPPPLAADESILSGG